MIKESFKDIGDFILGFENKYFTKYYKNKTINMFRIMDKTEYYWNYIFFPNKLTNIINEEKVEEVEQ